MTRSARRALSALTSAALLAGLFIGAPAPVRAAQAYYVGHEVNDYAPGSACADPDYATDGSWSVGGSGDGAYNSDDDAIQDAIDNASSGDTIFVCSGHYDFDTDLHVFDPGMNLTIVGDGIGETVLDGTDSTRLINANPAGDSDNGGTLTLKDLSIEDARTATVFDNGGAVNADGLSLTRVSISGSDNAYNGGALYAEGNVSIVDSTFTDNDTSEYGAVLYAWNPARTVSISNSVFDGNDSGKGGGAILATTVTVTGSTFTDNNAGNWGGAIKATTVTVTGSTFTANDAPSGGGAISATTVAVTNSTFTSSSAFSGGAIYAAETATVNRSIFTDNSACYGGAISVNAPATGTATVIGSTFTGNSAVLGGGISSRIVHATASTFTDNDAVIVGGAIYAWDTATLTSSTFARNDGGVYGGALYANTATIARSRFTLNTASEHGGAVNLYGPTSDDLQTLRGNTFSRNTAALGGAITLGSCVAPSRSQAARVLGANRFSGNRATQQRRTMNIERRAGDCA